MRKVVGISQKIKRQWMDVVLDRLSRTSDGKEVRDFLDAHLKDHLPGKESRAKAAGIVLRIWSGIPHEHLHLQQRAVALLPQISGKERIWLHWGMAALAYPFFRDCTEVIGRLLALQEDFTTRQVQARMVNRWGDRSTTTEAVQKLITSMLDWGVISSVPGQGHFAVTAKIKTPHSRLQLWLLESLLTASASDEIEAHQLLRLPEAFPFAFTITVADLRKHDRFDIHRQGLDMKMVALKEVPIGKLAMRAPKRRGKPKRGDTDAPHVQRRFFA